MLSEAVLITPSDNLFAFKEFAIQKISSQDSIVLVSKLHKGVGVIIHCAHRNTQNCWYAVLLSVESPPDEPYEVIFVNIFTYFQQTHINSSLSSPQFGVVPNLQSGPLEAHSRHFVGW